MSNRDSFLRRRTHLVLALATVVASSACSSASVVDSDDAEAPSSSPSTNGDVGAPNIAPMITAQVGPLTTTDNTSITLRVEDFVTEDPDDEALSLVILPGEGYSVVGNTVLAHWNVLGELTVNVAVSDGHQQSPPFAAKVSVTTKQEPAVKWGGATPKLLFRFRADGVGRSAGAFVGALGAKSVIARGGAGNATFESVTVQSFSSGAFKATAAAPPGADVGFTLLAHVRANRPARGEAQTIYSDLDEAGRGGTALELTSEGHLAVSWHDGKQLQRLVAAAAPLDDRWHFVVAQVMLAPKTPAASYARILVDGIRRAEVTPLPGEQHIGASNVAPCVAATCTGTGSDRKPSRSYLDGSLATVEMLNYPLRTKAIENPLLNDGGWYFGLPDRWDFVPPQSDVLSASTRSKYRALSDAVNDTGQAPEFNDLENVTTGKLSLPYLNDGIVYQGLSVAKSATADDTLYLLGHEQNDANEPDVGAMFVVDVDITGVVERTRSPVIRRTFRLVDASGAPLIGHSCGVLRIGNTLYTSATDGLGIYSFDLSKTRSDWRAGDASMGRPPIENLVRVAQHKFCNGANMTYDAPSNRLYCAFDGAQKLYGYRLGEGGKILEQAAESSFDIPDAAHALTLQGVAAYRSPDAKHPCFLLQNSNGQNGPSKVWKYCPFENAGKVTPLLDNLLPGGEGLGVSANGIVWGISEGTANKIQTSKAGSRAKVTAPWIWAIPRSAAGI